MARPTPTLTEQAFSHDEKVSHPCQRYLSEAQSLKPVLPGDLFCRFTGHTMSWQKPQARK